MPEEPKKKIAWSRIILWAIVVVTLGAVIIEGIYIRDLTGRTAEIGTTEIKTVLVDSIHSLNIPPAVEPTTGRQFIPAYHIVLPADPSLRLFYRNGEDSYLWFIDASKQSQAMSKVWGGQTLPEVFAGVKEAQLCSRGAVISFNGTSKDATVQDDKLMPVATVKLKDGRTASIYQNNGCPYGAMELVALLKQVQSF